jgi:hypothetical protein
MQAPGKIAEKRKSPRFRIRENALVVLKQRPRDMAGSLKDISLSGFAFSCLDRKAPSPEPLQFDILVPQAGVYIDNLPGRLVFERKIENEGATEAVTFRKHGVQFVGLSADQVRDLKRLIRDYKA